MRACVPCKLVLIIRTVFFRSFFFFFFFQMKHLSSIILLLPVAHHTLKTSEQALILSVFDPLKYSACFVEGIFLVPLEM